MRVHSDRQLIIDMQHGDRVAMEHFFNRYSAYLYAVCMRYVSDVEMARDLLHDAFIKIFTSIDAFVIDQSQNDAKLERSIKSWSARVTANMALNCLRNSSHLQFSSLDDLSDDEIPDDEVDPEVLDGNALRKLIEELPPNYRTVLNLFAIEGFTHREISQMLGISETLSATQYHRAKSMLKIKIKQYLNTQIDE